MPIERIYLFEEMSEQSRSEIFRIAAEESYGKGGFLFQAGDPADYLYILQEGRVRLCVQGAGHIAQIISDPGDIIGWSSMVGHDSYTASAECLTPIRLLKFERNRLAETLQKDPVSGLSFYKRLAHMIGRRLAASYGATLSVHGQRDPHSYG